MVMVTFTKAPGGAGRAAELMSQCIAGVGASTSSGAIHHEHALKKHTGVRFLGLKAAGRRTAARRRRGLFSSLASAE